MDTCLQTEAIARELWGGPVPAALPGEGEHASAGDVLPETRPHGNCLCPRHGMLTPCALGANETN